MGPAAWRLCRLGGISGSPSDHKPCPPGHLQVTGGAHLGSSGPWGWRPAHLSSALCSWTSYLTVLGFPAAKWAQPQHRAGSSGASVHGDQHPQCSLSLRLVSCPMDPAEAHRSLLNCHDPRGSPAQSALPKMHKTGQRAQSGVQICGVQESRAQFSTLALLALGVR